MSEGRPPGISSRVTSARGARHPWEISGIIVDLPLIIDWVHTSPSGVEQVRIDARIDLVAGTPQLVALSLVAKQGLDTSRLQREFRWATPLDIATGLIPAMIAEGHDPFAQELPLTGFPAAAMHPTRHAHKLSDAFLRTISREYLARGRGYAASLAEEYNVSRRTVVSWVEKARLRGLLSAPPSRGSVGGRAINSPTASHPESGSQTT